MNREELQKQFELFEISSSKEQLDLLFSFMKYTLEENEKFNLTAIKDEGTFIEKMILDSALVIHDLDLKNKTIIDVGTGAGFPGMIIKLLCPEAEVTLLDSTNKKIEHLKRFAVLNKLDLNFVSDRAENYSSAHRESFDYATARAVASLNILLEIITPLLKVGGTFLAMKGPGYEEEINASQNALKKLGCKISFIYEVELPESKEKRAIISITKTKSTNKKYPRSYGEIKNQPL